MHGRRAPTFASESGCIPARRSSPATIMWAWTSTGPRASRMRRTGARPCCPIRRGPPWGRHCPRISHCATSDVTGSRTSASSDSGSSTSPAFRTPSGRCARSRPIRRICRRSGRHSSAGLARRAASPQRSVSHPLVTVTGPGGIGKSRLAIAVARSLVDEFPDGVFYVDLASHDQVEPLLSELARISDTRLSPDGDPIAAILGRFVGRSCLARLRHGRSAARVRDAGVAFARRLHRPARPGHRADATPPRGRDRVPALDAGPAACPHRR